MNAMAAVAIGMFLGCWVIGPLVTHSSDTSTTGAAKSTPLSFEAMLARPDPFPYRTATPEFDSSGQPRYAEAAKAQAQAESGSRSADDAWAEEQAAEQPRRAYRPYRMRDRHAVY